MKATIANTESLRASLATAKFLIRRATLECIAAGNAEGADFYATELVRITRAFEECFEPNEVS